MKNSSTHPARLYDWMEVVGIKSIVGVFWLVSSIFLAGCTETSAPDKTKVESAPLPVAVVKVERQNLAQHLAVTAEFRSYQEVDLHAKVAGYLKEISVDIGDHVKMGQVLATLEIPEIQEDYKKALAACEAAKQQVNSARATSTESKLLFQRLTSAAQQRPGLIALQELDTAKARTEERAADFALAEQQEVEAEAGKNRLQDLLGYAQIIAPFDGVITHRYADTGSLIQAGTTSNTQTMPVVRLTELQKLRLVFPVPESVVAQVHVGQATQFTLLSQNRTYPATIARFTGKVDTNTRTMMTEAEIDNANFQFTPGMFATVLLTLISHPGVLAVPIQALSLGNSPTVLILDKEQRIRERPVQIGLETPDLVEITGGLEENDLVVVGNRSGLQIGQLAAGKLLEKKPVTLSSL